MVTCRKINIAYHTGVNWQGLSIHLWFFDSWGLFPQNISPTVEELNEWYRHEFLNFQKYFETRDVVIEQSLLPLTAISKSVVHINIFKGQCVPKVGHFCLKWLKLYLKYMSNKYFTSFIEKIDFFGTLPKKCFGPKISRWVQTVLISWMRVAIIRI